MCMSIYLMYVYETHDVAKIGKKIFSFTMPKVKHIIIAKSIQYCQNKN